MDQKLVADILLAEVQVGRKIKQNQDNLRQFEEFSPDSAFESLKRFFINSYSLNQSQSAQTLTQSKQGGALGSTYKGVVDLEKLTLIYRQYEENVSTFEIQAILQRHSAVSDKGMDYDCFLKLIGYNITDTKRKNQIFDSVYKVEHQISERCMKALSSIFLLELDLLRFTEVHKVSLVNNYNFDATNMFAKIDTENSSLIDFELMQSFFRGNGQEFTIQDFKVLLSRVKRGRQNDQPALTKQEFIQVVGPQLPYRGKNTTLVNSQGMSQIAESKIIEQNYGRSVHFSKDSVKEEVSKSSHRSNQQLDSKTLLEQSNATAQFNSRHQPQDTFNVGQQVQYQNGSSGYNITSSQQQQSQQVTTQLPINVSGQSQNWYMPQNAVIQSNQVVVPTQQVQVQPQPIFGQVFIPQVQRQEVYPYQAPIYQLGPAIQVPKVVYQNTYVPPMQSVVEKPAVVENKVVTKLTEELDEENSYTRSNRNNLALEAMNELLKKDNEKLKEENKALYQAKLEAEQINQRAREKELLRLEILEEQRLELKAQEEQKRLLILQQQQQQQQEQQKQAQIQEQSKKVVEQKSVNKPQAQQAPPTTFKTITFKQQLPIQTSIPVSPTKIVKQVTSPVTYVQPIVSAPVNTVQIPQTIPSSVSVPVLQQQPQVINYIQTQPPVVPEFVPNFYSEQIPIQTYNYGPHGYQNVPQQVYDNIVPYQSIPQNSYIPNDYRDYHPPQYAPQQLQHYNDYYQERLPYPDPYSPYNY